MIKMEFILALSLIIFSVSFYNYGVIESRLEYTLKEKKELIRDLNHQVQLAEEIDLHNNKTPHYLSKREYAKALGKDTVNSKDVFRFYNREVDYLGYKLSELLGYNRGMILSKYKIKKDFISKRLLLGDYYGVYSSAEAQELYVNSKKVELDYDGTYFLPRDSAYNVKYISYKLNSCQSEIDTIVLEREILMK